MDDIIDWINNSACTPKERVHNNYCYYLHMLVQLSLRTLQHATLRYKYCWIHKRDFSLCWLARNYHYIESSKPNKWNHQNHSVVLTLLFRVGTSRSRYSTTCRWPLSFAMSRHVSRETFVSCTLSPNWETRNFTMFKCPPRAAKWKAVSLYCMYTKNNTICQKQHNMPDR